MPRPKFRVVSMDEVKIRREDDRTIFSYADDSMGGWDIKIGPQVQIMSDQELLEYHNNLVLDMEAHRRDYEHVGRTNLKRDCFHRDNGDGDKCWTPA